VPSTTGAAAGDGEGAGDGEAARDGDAATDGGGVARGDDATAGACASAEGAPDRPAATAANTPTQRSGARRRCGPMAPPALLGTAISQEAPRCRSGACDSGQAFFFS